MRQSDLQNKVSCPLESRSRGRSARAPMRFPLALHGWYRAQLNGEWKQNRFVHLETSYDVPETLRPILVCCWSTAAHNIHPQNLSSPLARNPSVFPHSL